MTAAEPDATTLYRSLVFLVQTNEHGVEIINLRIGKARWLTDAAAVKAAADIAAIPGRVGARNAQRATDHYLLQFFGVQ